MCKSIWISIIQKKKYKSSGCSCHSFVYNSGTPIMNACESSEEADYALWQACRMGHEDAVKWALGLEVGEGKLLFVEELWEVRKIEGYMTKEKGYNRNYSPAFGQTAAHISAIEGHREILEKKFNIFI